MKLNLFQTEGVEFYEANAWLANEDYLLLECYSTLREAKSAVRAFKKSYKGDKTLLDCFVKHFDEYCCNDEDFEI